MAVETHGLTVDMAKDAMPFDTDSIGPATRPINDAKIQAWIEEGAASLNAILESKGVSPGSLSAHENGLLVIRRGIKSYVVLRSLEVQGDTSQAFSELRSEFEAVKRELRMMAFNTLGAAVAPQAVVKSNVPLTSRRRWRDKGW